MPQKKKRITRENKKTVSERKLDIYRNLLQNHIVHFSLEMFPCSWPLKQHHTLLKVLIPLTLFFPIGGGVTKLNTPATSDN